MSASIEQSAGPSIVHHVFSLRRSGHHAVISWLQACYEASGLSVHHANNIYSEHLGYPLLHPDPSPGQLLADAANAAVLMPNYEDAKYSGRFESTAYSGLQFEKTGASTYETVVVRDWYNMAASRLKHLQAARAAGRYSISFALDWEGVADCWMDHAQLVMQADVDPAIPMMGVNYNRWFTEPLYRDAIAKSYGLRASQATLDAVPEFGRGSSFDGLSKQGEAVSMNVLRRWEDLDPILLAPYRKIIEDETINALNCHIFGFGKEEVLKTMPA